MSLAALGGRRRPPPPPSDICGTTTPPVNSPPGGGGGGLAAIAGAAPGHPSRGDHRPVSHLCGTTTPAVNSPPDRGGQEPTTPNKAGFTTGQPVPQTHVAGDTATTPTHGGPPTTTTRIHDTPRCCNNTIPLSIGGIWGYTSIYGSRVFSLLKYIFRTLPSDTVYLISMVLNMVFIVALLECFSSPQGRPQLHE